tara:strand:- start:50103 stop:51722 length:1620 start_codon:yes stop_codon:yes gene_type:complete
MNPNIILILCDDLGYGDVSSLNPNSKINTTNIDQIFENGISFNDTHTSSAVCTPSRYSLLTGRYNFRSSLKSGVNWGYSQPLIENERPSVSHILKTAGYFTAMVGKWHLGLDWKTTSGKYISEGGIINETSIDPGIDFSARINGGPTDNGFDYFFGIPASLDMAPYVYLENDKLISIPTNSDFEGYAANIDGLSITQHDRTQFEGRPGPVDNKMRPDQVLDNLSQKAVEIIDTKFSEETPAFLYLALTAPHTPVSPSKDFVGKSGTNDQYLDFVLEVDNLVGEVINAVKRSTKHDDTLIIFTSDNGPERFMHLRKKEIGHFSAAQFRGCKRDNWEGGHRVPFLVQWPKKIAPKQESNAMISLVDIFATIAKITDQKYPETVAEDSYDFSSVLFNNSTNTFERQYLIHHSASGFFGIRDKNWKLLIHEGSGVKEEYKSTYSNEYGEKWTSSDYESILDNDMSTKGPIQLYHLSSDEHEDNNLFAENPEIVKELSTKFFEILNNGRSTSGNKQSNYNNDSSWAQVDETKDNLLKAGIHINS